MREIAISDIHGCALTFRALVEEQIQLTRTDHLYLLGDYIDRGPDSKGVIDYILFLRKEGYQVTSLRGNHEDLMLQAISGAQQLELWLYNGGDICLESYELVSPRDMPAPHWEFVQGLEMYHETSGHFLVHAGLNFRKDSPLTDQQSMLWIRDWYNDLDRNWLGDRRIIHGHTPQRKRDIERAFDQLDRLPVLNIDAGCFCYGELCAYDFTQERLYFQSCLDEVTW